MCGIAGWLYVPRCEPSDEVLVAMSMSIRHRGPDDHGDFWEVIVVDDASSEDVPQVLADRAVTYKRLTQNSGSSVARNVGVAQSSGRFVKFLDSDDVLVPCSLEAEYQAACTSRAEIVVCDWIETQLSADGTERVLHHRQAPYFQTLRMTS